MGYRALAKAFLARVRARKPPGEAVGRLDGIVDPVLGQVTPLASGAASIWMEAGTTLEVHGWALSKAHEPLRAFALQLGTSVFTSRYGQVRGDVARVFGSEAAGRSGFVIPVDTAELAPGVHRGRFVGTDAAGAQVALPDTVDFHLAMLQPLAAFFSAPEAAAVELAIEQPSTAELPYGLPGASLSIRCRAFDRAAGRPCTDVAAIVGDEEVVRGHPIGGGESDRFEILVPTAGREPGPLRVRIVALGPSGRAGLAANPYTVLPPVPSTHLGLCPLRSAPRIQARTRPARLPNGRVDTDRFVVEGYAYDPAERRALGALAFRMSRPREGAYPGGAIQWAAYGIPLPAGGGEDRPPPDSGFAITIDRRDFAPGEYAVEALALPKNLRGYLLPVVAARFTVEEPEPRRTVRKLAKFTRAGTPG